jgi:predicted esterase
MRGMMWKLIKTLRWSLAIIFLFCSKTQAQVDTTFIYNNNTPYGSLDIRIANSASWYYYLQEEKTFAFRESSPGVKTNTYLDMTSSWDSSPYSQGNLREKNGATDSYVMNYRLLKPQNYNATYSPGYPLLLILHGLGEAGNCSEFECHHADKNYDPNDNSPAAPVTADHALLNNDHQLTNGGVVHMKAWKDAGSKLPNDPTLAARAFPGFILFPQNLNGWDGATTSDAIRIVRLLCKKYNIDENRVYIHGLSNGGHGVYETVKRAPWMFAAVLTMSAIDDGFINQQQMAPAIAHVPLWVFQGALDQNPYPQKTENYIKKFRDAGAVVRYTKYANVGHGTWSTAYKEPDFFTWMLGKNKANIHSFSGAKTICSAAGLKLEVPAGYLAYQWQLNGQLISGANTHQYTATTAGKYKARFSRVANPTEAQWNRWSDEITITAGQGLPKATIKQHGTVVLPDLNNHDQAHLEAGGTFGHYYWYKDGAPVDFAGDQDDTIRHAIITPAMGKGAYTLVVSNFDNCIAPASDPKYLFFSNQAPVNITAPGNPSGAVNGSEVTIKWTDASANENGFEIWRRRKIDASSFSPWQMATLTAANTTSFKESALFPSSNYEYKVRAVSNAGRSNYAPSTGSVAVATGADTQPPAAPKNFTASSIGVKKVKLKWGRSTDNIGIKNYTVYWGQDSASTPGADTVLVLTNLPLNQQLTFSVKARDVANNLSPKSNESKAVTYVSGLYYEHSTGIWFDLDSINWSNPEFTGMTQTFSLSPRTQEEYFNFRFDGYLYITKGGTYQFRTGSDDGSSLTLDDKKCVDNDGVHNFKIVTSAAQSLATGEHRITVDFFEYNESDSLLVEYKGPDSNEAWTKIPSAALKSSETVITGIGPDNGPEDSFIVSVFPNPTRQDNVNIKVETVIPSPVAIQLLDPIGRELTDGIYEPDQLREGVQISTSGNLAPGIYFISVTQEKTTVRQRVLIKN